MDAAGWVGIGMFAVGAMLVAFGLALFAVFFKRALNRGDSDPSIAGTGASKPGFVQTLLKYISQCLKIMLATESTVEQKLMATGAFCVLLGVALFVGGLVPFFIGLAGGSGSGGSTPKPSSSTPSPSPSS